MPYLLELPNEWELTCDAQNWILKKRSFRAYYSNLHSALKSMPALMARLDSLAKEENLGLDDLVSSIDKYEKWLDDKFGYADTPASVFNLAEKDPLEELL